MLAEGVGIVPAPPPAEPAWIAAAADTHGFAWARVYWQRAAAVPRAWFDAVKADAVVKLWPTVFVHTEDRWAGKPFALSVWQEVVVRLLVGWKIPVVDEDSGQDTGVWVRLFRRLELWIARKGGKSEFLSALGLLFFALEGVYGGQGFCFGLKEDQGAVVFKKMATMVALSPKLKKSVTSFKKSLWIAALRAGFQLLAGQPAGSHGKSPTVIIGDEKHEWTEDTVDLADNLRQGTGARRQPIELFASTAGLKSDKTGYGLWREAQQIYEGKIDDPSTLVVIFAVHPDAPWDDESFWPQANPTIGITPSWTDLRREAMLARDNPRAEAKFRRYKLNQWVDQVVRWLSEKKWKACAPDPEAWRQREDELKGRRCWGGVDLSSNRDISAKVLLFEPESEGDPVKLLCKFWVPETVIETRSRVDRLEYAYWEKIGALIKTPGEAVDHDFIRHDVQRDRELYDVQGYGFDPWNAHKLLVDLQKDGVPPELLQKLIQGFKTLGEPTKEFERLVIAGLLDHGGHPVLSWMAEHVCCRFDENMNYIPARKRSIEKIDGISATVNAVATRMFLPPPAVIEYRPGDMFA